MEIGIASISFDRIPTELLMKIFDLLPANCLLNCRLTCRRWKFAAQDNGVWIRKCKGLVRQHEDALLEDVARNMQYNASKVLRRWLSSSQKVQLPVHPIECFTAISAITKKVIPPFWNDVCMWWKVQAMDHAILSKLKLCHSGPINHVFSHLFGICSLPWHMLFPEVSKPDKKCQCSIHSSREKERELTIWVLALIQKVGLSCVLQKIKEVLNIPSQQYFYHAMKNGVMDTIWLIETLERISSTEINLLSQTSNKHPCEFVSKLGDSSRVTVDLLWRENIVQPIQYRLLQILNIVTKSHSHLELKASLNSNSTKTAIQEIQSILSSPLWMPYMRGDIKTMYMDLERIYNQERVATLHSVEEFQQILIETKENPKNTAIRIMSKSSLVMASFSLHEITEYLSEDNYHSTLSSVTRALQSYSIAITTAVTAFCYMSNIRKSRKVTVLEHALQVCSHLYQMGDFMSLKYLLSAARACISQQHHTHVSWKNISDKGCKIVMKLQDIVSLNKGYQMYRQSVSELLRPFMPFLPAHQVKVQRCGTPSDNHIFSNGMEWLDAITNSKEPLVKGPHTQFLFIDISKYLNAASEGWDIYRNVAKM